MGTKCKGGGAVGSTSRKLTLFAATALAAAAPGVAHAGSVGSVGSVGVLPVTFGATYSNTVSAEDPYYPRFLGDTVYASLSIQYPTGGLKVTDQLGPTTFYTATTDNNYSIPYVDSAVRAVGNVKADAGSNLYYYIKFATTGGPTTVSRRVEGTVSATIGETQVGAYVDEESHEHSSALFYIYDGKGNGDMVSEAANADLLNNPLGETQTTHFDQMVTFQTNLIYEIVMTSSAVASYDHLASAFSDPYFDLSNLPDGVTFLESDGIGNALPNATPIPAALPLFVTGLGGLGYLARRRRKKGATA